jgi:predicted NBD/HSP70 family sugar kinase
MTTYYASSDIGGTFTDTAVLDSVGQLRRYKASTAPGDPVKGVLAAPTASAANLCRWRLARRGCVRRGRDPARLRFRRACGRRV